MATEVKWGIMSTAGIAEKFCVSVAEASNATIVAVASRDKAKAEAWVAANCEGARAYGSYDELLDDPEIQAVYIPLPTKMRTDWVVKAAEKKKHVLCEKPVATNVKDMDRCITACKDNGVQFMDNTMFMHNGRTAAMRKVLDNTESFGVPKHVVSSFSIPCGATDPDGWKNNIRMKADTEPLGALGDLGWYNVRFILWAFGYDNPEAVSCNYMEKTDDGVPVSVLANLQFSGGRTGSMDCSFTRAWRDYGEVTSEKRYLRVEDFVVTSKEGVNEFVVVEGGCAPKAITFPMQVIESGEIKEKMQHALLVEKFGNIVTSGVLEEDWQRISLQTNNVLLALHNSAQNGGVWTDVSQFFPGKSSGGYPGDN